MLNQKKRGVLIYWKLSCVACGVRSSAWVENIIEYFDEDAFKCLIKKVIIGENDENEKDPYVLNFILNSDNIDNSQDDFDDVKMQIAEFDCKVRYFVFNIDENNNRSKEIKDSIKVKLFSDINTNINIPTHSNMECW